MLNSGLISKANIKIVRDDKPLLKKEFHIKPFGSDFDTDDEEDEQVFIADLDSFKKSHSTPIKAAKVEEVIETTEFIPKVRPLKDIEPLSSLDQNGYRAIWSSLTQKDAFGIESSSARIRIHEERGANVECCSGNTYYDKCIHFISSMKMDTAYLSKEHLLINLLISKLFREDVYYSNKTTECGKEVLNWVKSIIGEKCKETLLQVVMHSIFQAVRRQKREIFKTIKQLLISVNNTDEPGKKFTCIMLKPYNKNEHKYHSFLKRFMVCLKVLLKTTESLESTLKYLTIDGPLDRNKYDFKEICRWLFYGVIYSNELVMECLGEHDRNGPKGTTNITSTYDSSSDDGFESIPKIIYNRKALYNNMVMTPGDKSHFSLFMMQTKTVQFTNFQITNRKPWTKNDFKALTTDPNADLYGLRYAQPKISYTKYFEKFIELDEKDSPKGVILDFDEGDNMHNAGQRHSRYETDLFSSMCEENDFYDSKGKRFSWFQIYFNEIY